LPRTDLERRYGPGIHEHTRRLVEAAGLTFDPSPKLPNTLHALQVTELAAEAGLGRDEAAEVVAEGRYADRIVASTQDANRLGVNGIPAFVLDRRLLVLGAQPEEVFEQAVAQLQETTPPAAN